MSILNLTKVQQDLLDSVAEEDTITGELFQIEVAQEVRYNFAVRAKTFDAAVARLYLAMEVNGDELNLIEDSRGRNEQPDSPGIERVIRSVKDTTIINGSK